MPAVETGDVAVRVRLPPFTSMGVLTTVEQMCFSVLGTPIEMNIEICACVASSLFLAAGTDSGWELKYPDGKTTDCF